MLKVLQTLLDRDFVANDFQNLAVSSLFKLTSLVIFSWRSDQ